MVYKIWRKYLRNFETQQWISIMGNLQVSVNVLWTQMKWVLSPLCKSDFQCIFIKVPLNVNLHVWPQSKVLTSNEVSVALWLECCQKPSIVWTRDLSNTMTQFSVNGSFANLVHQLQLLPWMETEAASQSACDLRLYFFYFYPLSSYYLSLPVYGKKKTDLTPFQVSTWMYSKCRTSFFLTLVKMFFPRGCSRLCLFVWERDRKGRFLHTL